MTEALRSETTGGIAGNWLWRQVEVGAITADEVDLYIAAGSQAGSRDLLDFAAGWSQPAPLGERYEHEITK